MVLLFYFLKHSHLGLLWHFAWCLYGIFSSVFMVLFVQIIVVDVCSFVRINVAST